MEFLDKEIGAQCQVCRKQDFLPFRCKGCKKMLCLEHRSPTLHDCAGLNITDATSMDCVVCGRSIVYDKNKSPDEVWEKHFATECTKVAAVKDKGKEKCPVQLCRNMLGPSNSYKCGKCLKTVCLTHRNPDDHECHMKDDRAKRKAFLDRLPKTAAPSASQAVKRERKAAAPKKPTQVDPANTLIGSSVRRGRPEENGLICPFCMKKGWKDANELQSHINRAHGESSRGASASSSLASPPARAAAHAAVSDSSSGGVERCPLCSATFRDPVELVDHFNREHDESRRGGNHGGNQKKKDSCTLN